MKPYDQQNREFIVSLTNLCDDRGHAAALRRWWSPATEHQAYPPLGRLGALGDWRLSTVAALYAVHGSHQTDGPGIGQAALRMGERKDGEHPYDRHFRRLIASRTDDDLIRQLHRLIKRLHNEGIPLDYVRLLKDLRFWSSGHEQKVKVNWAKEFWQAPFEVTP